MSLLKRISKAVAYLILTSVLVVSTYVFLLGYSVAGQNHTLKRYAVHLKYFYPVLGGLGHDDFIVLKEVGSSYSLPLIYRALDTMSESDKKSCTSMHACGALEKLGGKEIPQICIEHKMRQNASNKNGTLPISPEITQ